jgi:uncharacterized protein (UPF0303 family)
VTTFPDSATLKAEAERLVFPHFDEEIAYALGTRLVKLAQAEGLPIVINIRSENRCFFHAAMPGSAPLNDLWAKRKSATALLFHKSSLQVGSEHREKGETLGKHGLSSETHADQGGAVPIIVRGIGVVACVTVSGLPQVEDHKLAVRAIEASLRGA